MRCLKRFLRDTVGATAIEYGLIAAIVGVGIIVSVDPLKNRLNATFNKASNKMSTAIQ